MGIHDPLIVQGRLSGGVGSCRGLEGSVSYPVWVFGV